MIFNNVIIDDPQKVKNLINNPIEEYDFNFN